MEKLTSCGFEDRGCRHSSPKLTGPAQGREFRTMGMQGRGVTSTSGSSGDPFVTGSLALCTVVQPDLGFPGKPIANTASLVYFLSFLFPRSTSLQSATTCDKLATVLGVLSVPLRMWKVSTHWPADSGPAAVVDTSDRTTLRGPLDSPFIWSRL